VRPTPCASKVDGKRQLLMAGSGASPNGNRPFLDLLDLDTKEATRLWQSSPPFLEATGSIMSDANDVRGGFRCFERAALACFHTRPR
jgi:hypothetical protein